jgi:hypothetical protein
MTVPLLELTLLQNLRWPHPPGWKSLLLDDLKVSFFRGLDTELRCVPGIHLGEQIKTSQ